MEARRPLHYYEEALVKAIAARDESEAKKLIKLIQKSRSANLTICNEQNENFLLLALKHYAKTTAEILLANLKDSPDVIFATDKEMHTVIWYAARNGYADIMHELIQIAQSSTTKFEKKPWLLANEHSHTPLQIAAQSKRDNILKIILDVISKEKNADELINQGDKNADTALHKALAVRAIECVAILISYGADLNIHNNKKTRPIDALLNLSIEMQQEIFHLLNDSAKKKLLQIYKTQIQLYPDKALKTFYFRLQGLTSLQSLLFAHHDLGDMPLRNTFIKTKRVSEVKDEKGQYPVIAEEEVLEESALERMPLYRARLEKALSELEDETDVSKSSQSLSKDWINVSANDSNDKVHLLDNDRLNLILLLEDIDTFLTDLRNRRNYFYTDKALVILAPILCWLVLVGLMVGLYYGGEATQDEHHGHKHWNAGYQIFFIMAACCAGLGGFFASAGLGNYFCNREARVSKREWQNILSDLEENVNEKLQILEKKSDANNSLLPIAVNTRQNLSTQTSRLQQTQSLSVTIDIFSRLKDILNTVLEDMNKTNKPLSLFTKQEHVIDMPKRWQEDNQFEDILEDADAEELPLLKYY